MPITKEELLQNGFEKEPFSRFQFTKSIKKEVKIGENPINWWVVCNPINGKAIDVIIQFWNKNVPMPLFTKINTIEELNIWHEKLVSLFKNG